MVDIALARTSEKVTLCSFTRLRIGGARHVGGPGVDFGHRRDGGDGEVPVTNIRGSALLRA